MEKQNLPTYKHDFLNEKRWLVRESEHYVFHYFSGSEAEKDINMIEAKQESAFVKILAFLEVEDPKRKIEYYFYPDEKIKTELMGDDWYAQSIRDEFRIHVLYTKDIKPIGEHEDTHLLSLPWGISIGFLQEGLAEFMVGHAWDGKPHAFYVKKGYEDGLYPTTSHFFEHSAWLKTDDSKPLYFYSLAGAFGTFLIEKYGKEKFKELYENTSREKSKAENIKVFDKIYGSINSFEFEYSVKSSKMM
ncbi:MAG: hypothetical protein WCP15_00245 [bacterium]